MLTGSAAAGFLAMYANVITVHSHLPMILMMSNGVARSAMILAAVARIRCVSLVLRAPICVAQ